MPMGSPKPGIYPSIGIFDLPERMLVVFLLVFIAVFFLFLGIDRKSILYLIISVLAIVLIVIFFLVLLFLAQ